MEYPANPFFFPRGNGRPKLLKIIWSTEFSAVFPTLHTQNVLIQEGNILFTFNILFLLWIRLLSVWSQYQYRILQLWLRIFKFVFLFNLLTKILIFYI